MAAQRERDLPSDRTRSGWAAAKAKAVRPGTRTPEKAVAVMISAGKAAKLDFAAKVALVIAEIKAAGVQTLAGICECLNRRSIATRNGKNWYPATVRNVLRTPSSVTARASNSGWGSSGHLSSLRRDATPRQAPFLARSTIFGQFFSNSLTKLLKAVFSALRLARSAVSRDSQALVVTARFSFASSAA